MVNRRLILGICLTGILLLNARFATAQQPKPLSANPVIANPVDPASLNAPPAFGDSAPVQKKPVETPTEGLAPPKSTAAGETEWTPKLRVVLVTQAGTLRKPIPYHRREETESIPFFSDDSDRHPNDVKLPANKIVAPVQPFVIMTCDEVTVDAKASASGELAYSFSCKGKVILEIDDYTVTGDSMSSDEGKLTITNVLVKSNKATLTAEKMQIQLPIFGVRVESNSAEPKGGRDSLPPVPDAIDVPPAFPSSARLQSN